MNDENAQGDRDSIALHGSIAHVLELFRYAINGILFHRGVYPVEDFLVEKRFGLDLAIILTDTVEDYLELVLRRLRDWLERDQVKQMVLVIMDADDGHVIERWVFEPKINALDANTAERIDAQMDRELSAVLKDIITPTFLPPLESKSTVFNILAYTRDDLDEIPDGWDATHPHAVEGADEGEAEHDTMKGLRAPRHDVGMSVAYRDEDD